MCLLVQAKNGNKQSRNIEISCTQWEGSACTQSALIYFSFKFWVGGPPGGLFFLLSFVPNMFFFKFPMGSQYVPQVTNVFPKGVPKQHKALIPYILPKVLPFSPIYLGQKGGNTPSFHRIFYFGKPPQFQLFFAMGHSN